jgi:hypothetical protein
MFRLAMRNILFLSEVVESAEGTHGQWEVCATAEAGYDEAHSELVTTTECFVRPITDGKSSAKGALLNWLPQPDVVHRHVARCEAQDAAREVFRNWIRRVRRSIDPPITT